MSELKLNLIDANNILVGTIHGSVADRCIAALSAEPETIAELASALARYQRPLDDIEPFVTFRSAKQFDPTPWDAGLMLIDLAARIVVSESTYSQPGPEGEVEYHDGTQATEVAVPYRLPPNWLFVNSIDAYRWSRDRRREDRQSKLFFDARAVLYGRPLLEFIVTSCVDLSAPSNGNGHRDAARVLDRDVSAIHARWLITPREDLRGQSPRDVVLEKQDLIDFDMHTRCLQWSFLGEGPPCLSKDSVAFRFGGFGTHEWVVYYYLVRYLLWAAVEIDCSNRGSAVVKLEDLKSSWLENPSDEFDGRVPAIIIENERRRLPQTISAKEMIIDDDCELCRMSAQEVEMGFGPGFWHLDGCNMDEGFAFSHFRTLAEWEADQRHYEEFNRNFEREQQERSERLARGEPVEADPF